MTSPLEKKRPKLPRDAQVLTKSPVKKVSKKESRGWAEGGCDLVLKMLAKWTESPSDFMKSSK